MQAITLRHIWRSYRPLFVIFYTAQVTVVSDAGVVSRSEVCLVIIIVLLSTAKRFSLTLPQRCYNLLVVERYCALKMLVFVHETKTGDDENPWISLEWRRDDNDENFSYFHSLSTKTNSKIKLTTKTPLERVLYYRLRTALSLAIS